MIRKKEVKSPLRYPGGKSRAVDIILDYIPNNFDEFREPFVGGGSVFLSVKQRLNSKAKYYINDINYDLYCFWYAVKNDIESLIENIYAIKSEWTCGNELFNYYSKNKNGDILYKAVRFFVLNRITFSGVVDSGGYSQKAFDERFTMSSIDRVKLLHNITKDINITRLDYTDLLFMEGENVFIFLDPPYLSATKSKLYGNKGHLHTFFDHKKFSDDIKKCKHKYLITLDDCDEIRDYFSFANIYEWQLQYGMNNYKQGKSEKGKELLITNYEVNNLLFK